MKSSGMIILFLIFSFSCYSGCPIPEVGTEDYLEWEKENKSEQKSTVPLIKLCKKNEWQKIRERMAKNSHYDRVISEATLSTCINRSLCENEIGLFSYFITLTENGAQYVKPFCIAKIIKQGNVDVLKSALNHGLKLSTQNRFGNLLHMAARSQKNSARMTKLLLIAHQKQMKNNEKSIFDINERDKVKGVTPLYNALYRNSYGTAQRLLDGGADFLSSLYEIPYSNKLKVHDGQIKLVNAWLERNGFVDVRSFVNDDNHSGQSKRNIIQFLSHGLSQDKQDRLQLIWKKYENKKLSAILKDHYQDRDSAVSQAHVKKTKNLPKFKCLDLCNGDEKKTYLQLGSCQHHICQDCAQQLVEHKLKHPLEAMTCPSRHCQSSITSEALQVLGVNQLSINELEIQSKEKKLSADPHFRHCHQADCRGGSFVTFGLDKKNKKAHFKCEVCQFIQCEACGQHHPGVACKDYQFVKIQLEKNNFKKCPKCQMVIEKNKGCDHMTCQQCDYEFYWSTLKKYDR